MSNILNLNKNYTVLNMYTYLDKCINMKYKKQEPFKILLYKVSIQK